MKDDLQILIECLAHARDNGIKIRFYLRPDKKVLIKDTDQASLKLPERDLVSYIRPDGDEYGPALDGEDFTFSLVEPDDTLLVRVEVDSVLGTGLTTGEVKEGILKALGTPDEEAPPEN